MTFCILIKELHGLAFTITLCTLGAYDINSAFHRRHSYSLVYGMEAILPIEMGVRSLRTMLESEFPKIYWL